jgi:tetratricopeptide (TPR) repeat protein
VSKRSPKRRAGSTSRPRIHPEPPAPPEGNIDPNRNVLPRARPRPHVRAPRVVARAPVTQPDRSAQAGRGNVAHSPPTNWSLGVVLSVAFVAKAIVLWQLHDHPLLQPVGELDSAYYVDLARRVAGGDWAAGDRVYFVSPLYLYFLAGTFVIVGESLRVVQVLQIALGVAAVWLIAASARAWFDGRTALVAGGLAAATGYFTFNEILILQSSIDPFLTALALNLLARALRWPVDERSLRMPGRGADETLASRRPTGVGRLLPRRELRAWIAAGVAFGLLILNRPNALVPTIGVAAALVVCGARASRQRAAGIASDAVPEKGGEAAHAAAASGHRDRWRAVGPAVALLGGVMLALFPVTIRNAVVAGEFASIASHGGLNFYIGNNADADGTYRRVEGITPSIVGQERDSRRVVEAAAGRPLTDAEVSAYFFDRAWDWIRAEPLRAMSLFVRKLRYTFHARDVALNYSYAYYSRDEPTLLRALIVGPALLIPFGLFGWIFAGTKALAGGLHQQPHGRAGDATGAGPGAAFRDLESQVSSPDPRAAGFESRWWVWSLFVPFYAVSVAAFFVSGRYRMPLLVPFCVMAAAAITWLDATWRQSRQRRVAWISSAIVALLAIVTNWPIRLDDGRGAERTEMILHLVSVGRDRDALDLLARTERDAPDRGLVLYRVGRAFVDRGAAIEAVRILERALQERPEEPAVRLALGEALLDAGRPADAVPHLRAALDAGTRPEVAAFDLARALDATGDRDEARRVLRTITHVGALDAASAHALARLALALDELALAEDAADRAVELEPQAAAPRETLGLVLSRLGRYAQAISELEVACRRDPASATARLNLAVLYAEGGRVDDARRRAEEALRLRPDYTRAREFLAALPH